MAIHGKFGGGGRPDQDPEKLGKLGASKAREPNVTGALARRLGRRPGGAGARGRAPGSRGTTPSGRHVRLQRVVVKVHHSRHKGAKAAGLLRAHVRYLGRDSARGGGGEEAREQRDSRFYDASREGVDAATAVKAWASDRHHFRIIVSPEQGREIPDMTAFVRELMRRVERDLGTGLEWHAVNHFDTDNPHAHVMLRGRRDDGNDLVIAREYVGYGLRRRAQELATELIGERTPEQEARALRAEVTAERYTSLDRHVERRTAGAGGGELTIGTADRLGFTAAEHEAALRRLEFLAALGLAERTRGTWRLEPGWAEKLRELGQRNDVIKSLQKTLGNDAARVQRAHADGTSRPVAGVVVDRGAAGEFDERWYLVVRDAGGALHYGQVRDDEGYRAVAKGAIVELGRSAAADRKLVEATRNRGEVTDSKTGARLAKLARYPSSGVRAGPDGRWEVDAERLSAFLLGPRGSARTDVRVFAPRSLEEQATARAWTWLDRQLYRRDRAYRDGKAWAPPVAVADFERAAEARRLWLVGQGFARRQGDRFTLRTGAARRLAREELAGLGASIKQQGVASVSVVPPGGEARGTYAGTYFLHAGPHAAVRDGDRLLLAPTRRVASMEIGTPARLAGDGRGATRLTRSQEGRAL